MHNGDRNRPKYEDPVCPLVLALYGHPKSGKYWEDYADASLKKQGWTCIEEWKSCYWHPKLKCTLILYVDDFKIVGPKESMAEAWAGIRKHITIGDAHPVDHFLGVKHEFGEFDLPTLGRVRGRVLNNEDFMKKCVETYLHLAPKGSKLKKVSTPFRQDTPGPHLRPCKEGPWQECPFCRGRYPPEDFKHGDTRKPMPKCEKPKVIPQPDHVLHPGVLAPIAPKVLMMILYGARAARPDLLRQIGNLARYFTKWCTWHDEELHYLICYINSTFSYRHFGYVDPAEAMRDEIVKLMG